MDRFLFDAAGVRRIVDAVRRSERAPQRGIPRGAVPPVLRSGGRLWQCVYPLRLTPGTPREPDNRDLAEPVCVCVPLGQFRKEVRSLSNLAVFQLRTWLDSVGLVGATSGQIARSTFNEIKNDPHVAEYCGADNDQIRSLALLRTRYYGGYAATGSILWGTNGDILGGVGPEFFDCEPLEDLHGADTEADRVAVRGEIVVNAADVERLPETVGELVDRVFVRDGYSPYGVASLGGQSVEVQFRQPLWFADSSAINTRHWQYDADYGWLPVMDLVSFPPAIIIGKTSTAISKGSQGAVEIWQAVTSYGTEAATGVVIGAWNLFANVSALKWVAAVRLKGYWYLIAAEC